MSEGKDPATQVIALELNDPQIQHLEDLLATGLWGETLEDVAQRLIDQKLWDVIPELRAWQD